MLSMVYETLSIVKNGKEKISRYIAKKKLTQELFSYEGLFVYFHLIIWQNVSEIVIYAKNNEHFVQTGNIMMPSFWIVCA
jgi:hypothetical protein